MFEKEAQQLDDLLQEFNKKKTVPHDLVGMFEDIETLETELDSIIKLNDLVSTKKKAFAKEFRENLVSVMASMQKISPDQRKDAVLNDILSNLTDYAQ